MGGKTRKRWWIAVAILCVGVAVLILANSSSKTSAHSLAFLKGAKQLKSESKIMTVNRYVGGAPPVPTQIKRQIDTFEHPRTFEEVRRMALAELRKGGRLHTTLDSPGLPKRSYLVYQKVGAGTVSVQIEAAEDRSKTRVVVSEHPPLSWLDRGVAWLNKLFGR